MSEIDGIRRAFVGRLRLARRHLELALAPAADRAGWDLKAADDHLRVARVLLRVLRRYD